MKTKLLAGASTLVLALGLSASALAQQNENANDNDPWTAISQNSSGDAVSGAHNAVEDGAIAGQGNAIGEFADNNAAASRSSTAIQIDASDQNFAKNGFAPGEEPLSVNGGEWYEDGRAVVSDGSQVNVGDNNKPASASFGSASATGRSAALSNNGEVAEGSSQTIGNGNSTATAEDGGAAIVGHGTAIGINNVTIGENSDEDFDIVNLSAEGGEDEGEGQSLDAAATSNGNGNGHDFGGSGDDATVAFGIDNTVASAHLASTVSGLVIAISGYPEGENGSDEHAATIKTGAIFNNAVSSASGANRVVFNTGTANQGRALAIAANTSFGD